MDQQGGVYTGGDIMTGSATVISAMGGGRKTAKTPRVPDDETRGDVNHPDRPGNIRSRMYLSPGGITTPPSSMNNAVRCSITKNTRVIYIIYS